MSAARDAILGRIRQALPSAADSDAIRQEAEQLISVPEAFQPKFEASSSVERFIEKATSPAVTATVAELKALADVPDEVRRYVKEKGLEPHLALQPSKTLSSLDWSGLETRSAITINEPLAVTLADLAVAETGSVVFQSGPDAPFLMNFLPLHHIVVVRQDTILRHIDDVFPAIGTSAADQPRGLSIVTGTSGTADIEAVNVRGAHGPRFMHILLVPSS